jgi:hypothetical protein
MEKIYICSDIHNDYLAFQSFIEKARECPIIICGDLTPSSQNFSTIFSQLNNDLYMVKGNCDNAYDFSIANINIPARIQIENFFNKNVLITHGDIIKNPSQSSIELNCGDIFISGHTHVPQLYTDENGVIILNPGSLSRPRGKFDSSYATLDKNKIEIRTLKKDHLILTLTF